MDETQTLRIALTLLACAALGCASENSTTALVAKPVDASNSTQTPEADSASAPDSSAAILEQPPMSPKPVQLPHSGPANETEAANQEVKDRPKATLDASFNYAEALQKSLCFYELWNGRSIASAASAARL